MIRAAFAALGRALLFIASLAFVVALSIFVFGSFILTWPILRLSPRDQRIKATMGLASAVMTLFTVLGTDKATKTLADALAMAEEEGVLDDLDEVEPVPDSLHDRWLREQLENPLFREAYERAQERHAATLRNDARLNAEWPPEGIPGTMRVIEPDDDDAN